MATKVSAALIILFLITLPVLAGRPSALPAPAETQVVDAGMATAEATEEATAEATAVAVALVGDPVRGEDIFRHGFNEAPPCITCHSPTTSGKGTFSIGPGLLGISERGATRVEGETAEEYIAHSIRHPADFLVPGYNPVMPGIFGERYSDQDIADIVAYLMSL